MIKKEKNNERRLDKAGIEFSERTEELKVRKDGIDEELEKLIKKIKDRVIMKRKGKSGKRKW